MSKLLTMLSKLNRAPASGVVPPDIHVSVTRDLEAGRSRRRYILCGVVCICAVLLGVGVRLYFEKGFRRQPEPRPPQVAAVVQQMPMSSPHETASALQPDRPQGGTVAADKDQSVTTPARKTTPSQNRRGSVREKRISEKSAPPAAPEAIHTAKDTTVQGVTPQLTVIDKEARDAWVITARSAEKRKAYAEALRMYRKALVYDQENHSIMNNAAGMHIRLGEHAAALALCDRALQLAKDYIPALINQGIARSALGNTSGAEDSFTRALELDPANRGARYNLALFDEKNGRLDASVQQFKRLAAGGEVSGLIGLARVYEKQSRMDEAMKVYADVAAMHDIPAEARNTAIVRLRLLRNQ